mmetsp:Transcript_43884/g.103084  ORF Transcript_43884/g.103084 Transcript_43884/m.103084 type:complete len:261 (+) Transcript_43884:587-1369(+)
MGEEHTADQVKAGEGRAAAQQPLHRLVRQCAAVAQLQRPQSLALERGLGQCSATGQRELGKGGRCHRGRPQPSRAERVHPVQCGQAGDEQCERPVRERVAHRRIHCTQADAADHKLCDCELAHGWADAQFRALELRASAERRTQARLAHPLALAQPDAAQAWAARCQDGQATVRHGRATYVHECQARAASGDCTHAQVGDVGAVPRGVELAQRGAARADGAEAAVRDTAVLEREPRQIWKCLRSRRHARVSDRDRAVERE